MKKVVSIILIAAAAFGFYGGAVNLNDVLDCKAYWEEEGRKSDENLDKLQDGVDKLEENSEAYLDGKVQYAEGQATLAQAKADFAAAPAQLAQGKKDLASLSELIAGLKTLSTSSKELKEGYATLIAGRKAMHDPETQASLLAAGAQLSSGALASVYGGVLEGYVDYINNTDDLSDTSNNALEQFCAKTKEIGDGGKQIYAYAPAPFTNKGPLSALAIYLENTVLPGVTGERSALKNYKDLGTTAAQGFMNAPSSAEAGAPNNSTVLLSFSSLISDATKKTQYEGAIGALTAGMIPNPQGGGYIPLPDSSAKEYANAVYDALGDMITGLNDNIASLKENNTAAVAAGTAMLQLEGGIEQNRAALYGGTYQIAAGIYGSGNADLISAFQKAGAKYGLNKSAMKGLATTSSIMATSSRVSKIVAVLNAYDAFIPAAKKIKLAGEKTLAKGLATFKAAPALIAEGEAKLADAAAKLGEYEDGEKTLRDGLKTLMDTKAEGGLKSIKARVGENETFTNADGELDFPAAHNAVQQGRNYSADSSAAITPELTNRGIASAIGLGAAALALIAAILGLLKKKKGAGVFGILAAIAGAVALVMAKSAGTTWTVLAGSTVGSAPLVAFGVLAVVALIFAIAQFAGKEA